MDRSFLSDPAVVTASRKFVCVRLATYEDESENRFLKSLIRTGSGELENSVFAIFAPDATTKLVRGARGPQNVFRDAAEMAAKMTAIAGQYQAKDKTTPPLPIVATVPLAVTVAAADNLPLVIVSGPKSSQIKFAELAWSAKYTGRFIYAFAENDGDWKTLAGITPQAGVTVVQPDTFGRSVTLLSRAVSEADWSQALDESLSKFKSAEKNQRTHIREGAKAGVFYEPKTPVTDPMEQRARERLKNQAKPKENP